MTAAIDDTYNGWTNWETWNTALMLNNDQRLQLKALEIARFGQQAKFEDYAIKSVIAPHNALMLDQADEWNSIPFDERPGKFDFEKADIDPMVIDEAKVNWDEIFESFRDTLRENDYSI